MDASDPQLNLPPLRDYEVGRVGVALERAVAAIRQRHRSECEALAGIAHELAAPLTVVAGQLEALPNEDASPRLHAARDAARELLHTSNDLLTLARGELKLPLEMSVVSLAQVTTRVSAEYATLEVIDDGSGLNTDALAHLFERHYTQRDGQGGSGIGLSIVHDLVLAHGGTVVALEGPDGRALFRVRLPALGAQLEAG